METNIPFMIQIMSAVSAKNSANITVDLRVKYGFIYSILHEEPERAKFWTRRLIRLLFWHRISLKGLLHCKRNRQGDYNALVSV